MLAFHTQLVSHGRAADKNLFKLVWGLMRRVPVLPVYGHACWRPLEFMIQMCPVKTRSMTPEVARTRQLECAPPPPRVAAPRATRRRPAPCAC